MESLGIEAVEHCRCRGELPEEIDTGCVIFTPVGAMRLFARPMAKPDLGAAIKLRSADDCAESWRR
jgi:hypothetical protein